jgi:hypothetical protein
MAALARRADIVPRWSDVPPAGVRKPQFLLGQNARGLWVIRDSTGAKSGVFVSREAAMRFARLESPEGHAVVHVSEAMEFDYAAQHL